MAKSIYDYLALLHAKTRRARADEGHGERRSGFATVLLIFGVSRLAFYVVAFLATWLLPQAGSPPVIVEVTGHAMLALHWRWDAIHYYSVAFGGYDAYITQPMMTGTNPAMLYAFFPLFPLLMWVTAFVLGGFRVPVLMPIPEAGLAPLLAGVLVVHVATLLALWFLYQLAREETGDDATAERTVLYTAFFPLALYYAVPYAEPLYLAASVGAMFAARRRRWVRAGLWIAVAGATRPFGILLLPPLMLEMLLAWRHGGLRRETWSRAFLGLLLAPMGLLLFMFYLWWHIGDPLAFVHAQESFWNREAVFPLTTLWRGIGYTLHPTRSGAPDTYARTVLHTLVILLFLSVLLVSVRTWRPTYVVYGLLLLVQILAVPWPGDTIMHTLGRSVMVFFPVYLSLAHWGRRPIVHQTIIGLWLPLFGLLSASYAISYFVA